MTWLEDYANAPAGNFLNAKKVKDGGLVGRTLTIKSVEKQQMKDNQIKPILSFNETDGTLPLNKGNAATLIERYGSDEATWSGKNLQLIITKKQFQGQLVDGITVVPIERVNV